jgi:hypothetical protein
MVGEKIFTAPSQGGEESDSALDRGLGTRPWLSACDSYHNNLILGF